jgi:uncharacterized membrane protein (DUF2068 family)
VTQPAVATPKPSAAPAPAAPAGTATSRPIHLHKVPKRWPVVLIGIGKLLKTVGLVVVSFVLKALLAPDKHLEIENWLNNARLEPHNWFLNRELDIVEHSLGIDPSTLRWLHVGVIIYAGLYLIEGVGLLFDKKWAEWMVVVTTAGFLPLEVYEICREVTWGRCLLFVANVVVLSYLIFRLHRQAVIKRELKALGA